jgi:hypothetical protein
MSDEVEVLEGEIEGNPNENETVQDALMIDPLQDDISQNPEDEYNDEEDEDGPNPE